MEEQKLQRKSTVLEMVLSSLCPYHKMLLYHILKRMHEDYVVSITSYKDAHRHFSQTDSTSCHLSKKPDKDAFGFSGYRVSDGRYVHSCRLNACSVTPVCFCLKNLHYLSCQSVTISCINNIVAPRSCSCCVQPQRCPCTSQSFSESAHITPIGRVARPLKVQNVCDSFNPCVRACSPSPPPLSPRPPDTGAKTADNTICSFVESRCLSNQPPFLIRHEEESDARLHKDTFNIIENTSTENTEMHAPSEDCTDCCIQTGRHFEQNQNGPLLQDLMERINKKLKSIEPLEKEQNIGLSDSQRLSCNKGGHMGEILTTILHKETLDDCNIKELLHQNELMETEPIQTHLHRKQETLTTRKSPDLSVSPPHSLQIKRERASHSLSPCKKKVEPERGGGNCAAENDLQLPCMEELSCSGKIRVSQSEKDEMTKDNPASPQNAEGQRSMCENTHRSPEKEEKCRRSTEHGCGNTDVDRQPPTDSNRSRRNIVPPQRFSAYVTEPRKMYFAACFSESIFSKRVPKDTNGAATAETSCSSLDLNEPSAAVNEQPDSPEVALHANKCKDDERGTRRLKGRHLRNASSTRSGNCAYAEQRFDDGSARQRGTKQRESTLRSCVRLRSSMGKSHRHIDSNPDNVSPRNHISESITTVKDAATTSDYQSVPQYSSPIRLMFVSPVIGEEGVKYTLVSATSGSVSQQEAFDPCEESSWAGPTETVDKEECFDVETAKARVIKGDENSPHKRPVTTDVPTSSSPLSEEHQIQRENCLLIHGLTLSPPKRKPGRPKKLGPQIEKPVKRPIGRPPKHKETSKCVPNKGNPNVLNKSVTVNSYNEDDRRKNNNLKITVVYGRSRRIRRLVSEGSGHFTKDQHVNEGIQTVCTDGLAVNCSSNDTSVGASIKNELSETLLEQQVENFSFVIPVKNKKSSHPGRNIKCAAPRCSTAMRKPGRPPKVKISGISVTVTTVSPKQRKIRINKEMTEMYNEMSEKSKPFISNCETPKEQVTIDLQSDAADGKKVENFQDGIGLMSQKTTLPLRHSVRVRKPSVHLLHSVATSRAFTRSNALLRRSRKLLLNKASGETNQIKSLERPVGQTLDTISEISTMNSCGQDLSILSGISVDSIFKSNESFKWWPTSASAEMLNEEFTRRIQLMSDTWVTESLESSKSLSTEKKVNLKPRMHQKDEPPKNSLSPIKMLFQKHCNMEKLCAWFMQTTETQSLAIVKKASVRNEIVQYNPIRTTSRSSVCPSPQAERLRKHVKKFAKIVPKSPAMHLRAQQRMFSSGRLQVKRRLVFLGSSRRIFRHRCLLARHKMLGKYGFLRMRVKSKFMTRKKTYHNLVRPLHKAASVSLCGSVPYPSKETEQLFSSASSTKEKEQCSLNMAVSEQRELGVQQTEKDLTMTDVSQEERICSKTWSPERLKECRVFLKKINSPETKSAVEECNFCTIKLDDVSSSGYSLTPGMECGEIGVRKEIADASRGERSRRSPRAPSLRCPEELQGCSRKRKREKRKNHGTSRARPVKVSRQSPSSSHTGKT